MIKAVDLFCGAGGLTHGLQLSGVSVAAGYDIDATCRYAYEANNNAVFINKSVTELELEDFERYYSGAKYRILAGCAPCQPFSTYSRKIQDKSKKDGRWTLLNSFGEHIAKVLPEIVTMENVPGLIKQDVFSQFLDLLSSLGYQSSYKVVFCPDYGLPQSRSRLVLLASRLGPINLIDPTHTSEDYVTLKQAISHLPEIEAGETHPSDRMHRSAKLGPLNLARIKASKPGGTWRDWPEELVAECHKKSTGSTYSSVYGRMSWDKVSPTITTQFYGFGNGRFGHPEQNRALSVREAALLQSFPNHYEFWPVDMEFDLSPISRMIGNAVPVKLGEIVGRSITNHIELYESTT